MKNLIDIKIFLNTFYQTLGKVVISLLGIIATAFLSRYLGKFAYGEYSLVFSYIGIVAIFPDFGLGTLITREIAAKRATVLYFSHIFTLRFILSIIASLLGLVFVFYFPYSANVKTGILVGLIGSLFLSLSSIMWGVFQGELSFGKIVMAQVVSSLVSTTLVVLGVLFKAPFIYFIVAAVSGNLAGYFVSKRFFSYTDLTFALNKSKFISLIKESWPLGLGLILSVAYFKIDSIILSVYYNPAQFPDLGYYSLAYKCFEVILVFGGFFTQTLFPVFSEALSHKSTNFKKYFRKYLSYSVALSVFGTLGLFIFAQPLVDVLGGSQFQPAVNAVKILALGVGVSILGGFFLAIDVAGGKQHLLALVSFIALIINVILNLIFVPQFSFIAASWITVGTQSLIFIANALIAAFVVKRHRNW